MSIQYLDYSGYSVLPTGWGCHCPDDTNIESEEECLAVASQILSSSSDSGNSTDSTELTLSQNTWEYGPCGCFIWKGGKKVYYTGNRKDLHCVAVQWAELICKTNGEDKDPVLATEIADYSNPSSTWTKEPENSRRKCLDWFGDNRFIHLKQNRDLCMTIEDNYHGSDAEREGFQYPLILKPCKELSALEDAEIFYDGFHDNLAILKHSVKLCLASAGKEIGSPVIVEKCRRDEEYKRKLQKWTYDSNGRFRNVFNGGYIGLQHKDEGGNCHTISGSTIVTSTIQGDDGCDLTQWLPYNNYNDEIPLERLWYTVVAIYGPLLISIVCLIILGIMQRRPNQQTIRTNRINQMVWRLRNQVVNTINITTEHNVSSTFQP